MKKNYQDIRFLRTLKSALCDSTQRGTREKDRVTLLSRTLLRNLRRYYKAYKAQGYLFRGQRGGKYYERSAQMVLKKAAGKANLHTYFNEGY